MYFNYQDNQNNIFQKDKIKNKIVITIYRKIFLNL